MKININDSEIQLSFYGQISHLPPEDIQNLIDAIENCANSWIRNYCLDKKWYGFIKSEKFIEDEK